MTENLHPMYNKSCARLITAYMLLHKRGKGVILNTRVEIVNLFKALVLPKINYPLPVYGASVVDLNSIQCLLRQCFKRHFILEPVDIHKPQSTLSQATTLGAQQSGCL